MFRVSTIYGRLGEHDTPYLTRIILGRLRFHIFHRGDADPDPHDHPWGFWTFPLRAYDEQVAEIKMIPGPCNYEAVVTVQRVQAWRWHRREKTHMHRVLGRTGSRSGRVFTVVWTDRLQGPEEWGFLVIENAYDWSYVPWRSYLYGED